MSSYRVSIPYILYVDVQVETDDKESAIEEAIDHASTMVVGASSPQASVRAPVVPAKGGYTLGIEVKEI